MRSLSRLGVLVSASALVLSGCAGGGNSERPTLTTTVQVDSADDIPKGAGESGASQGGGGSSSDLRAMYAPVFDNPGAVPVNPAADYDPKGTYAYAFAEVTGDDKPEMLLRVDSAEFSPVVVLTTDSNGNVVPSADVLITGAAGAGGTRAAVQASESGNGLYQIFSHSIRREATSEHYTLEGRNLTKGASEEFHVESSLPDHQEVQWLDMDGGSADGGVPAPAPSSGDGDSAAPAGSERVTGTVDVRTAQELMDAHGAGRMPNESDKPTDEYVVFVLDQPLTVSGMRAGSAVTETVTELSLGPATAKGSQHSAGYEGYERYDGQKVTITFNGGEVGFPSDTSLPLGMPGIRTAIISID